MAASVYVTDIALSPPRGRRLARPTLESSGERAGFRVTEGRRDLTKRHPGIFEKLSGSLEADLVRALDAGQVSGAALDVLSEDSPDLAQHPLAGRRDVLLTPHVAFYSEAALADLRRISAQNIAAYLQGRMGDLFCLVTAPEPGPAA